MSNLQLELTNNFSVIYLDKKNNNDFYSGYVILELVPIFNSMEDKNYVYDWTITPTYLVTPTYRWTGRGILSGNLFFSTAFSTTILSFDLGTGILNLYDIPNTFQITGSLISTLNQSLRLTQNPTQTNESTGVDLFDPINRDNN